MTDKVKDLEAKVSKCDTMETILAEAKEIYQPQIDALTERLGASEQSLSNRIQDILD